MARFTGVYPVLYAFFGKHGPLNPGAMRAQIDACLRLSPAGIVILGLATEVEKLSLEEKQSLIALSSKTVAGRIPLAVTIGASSAEERFCLIDVARACGASWLILQPPPDAGPDEDQLLSSFAAMMKHARLPAAIQHAPQYLGVNPKAEHFLKLQQDCRDFSILKGEGSALETAGLIADTKGSFSVFAGRGGLEWPDMLRCGASGLIPAPEILGVHLAIQQAAIHGDWIEADRLYVEALPLITFIMQSLASCRCYGKRLLARRIGLGEVHDRAPSLAPTPQGMTMLGHWSSFLKPWP
jgi:4-hydroxy-tetrahydrodipicolinate synthase